MSVRISYSLNWLVHPLNVERNIFEVKEHEITIDVFGLSRKNSSPYEISIYTLIRLKFEYYSAVFGCSLPKSCQAALD